MPLALPAQQGRSGAGEVRATDARRWARRRSRLRPGLAAWTAGLIAFAAIAWAATVTWRARGYSSHGVAEPTPRVPSDVVFYPHVLYGGDAAYLVDGRWFRPGVSGWEVFTEEPVELAMIRESLEKRQAEWFQSR